MNENFYKFILIPSHAKHFCNVVHLKLLFCLFDLWFYIPVNNYGHVETVPGQASLAVNSVLSAHPFSSRERIAV